MKEKTNFGKVQLLWDSKCGYNFIILNSWALSVHIFPKNNVLHWIEIRVCDKNQKPNRISKKLIWKPMKNFNKKKRVFWSFYLLLEVSLPYERNIISDLTDAPWEPVHNLGAKNFFIILFFQKCQIWYIRTLTVASKQIFRSNRSLRSPF